MSTQDNADTKLRLASEVKLYREQPTHVEHERLRPLIEQHYGADSAEFFDQEGCLPLTEHGGLGGYPWPMHRESAHAYSISVLMVSVMVPLILWWLTLGHLAWWLGLILAAALGALTYLTFSYVVASLFSPNDRAERDRLDQQFREIEQRNRETAEAKAREAREARRTPDQTT